MTCKKSQEFLANKKIEVAEVEDAKKRRFSRKEVLGLARSARKIVVAKGKRIVELDMVKEPPEDATILSLLLGPSGNLRAPTARLKDMLIVGFHPDVYRDVMKR